MCPTFSPTRNWGAECGYGGRDSMLTVDVLEGLPRGSNP